MTDKIYVGIDNKKIEIKGKELENLIKTQEELVDEKKLHKAEQQAKEAARESAMAKLKALGLTDDEISALVP